MFRLFFNNRYIRVSACNSTQLPETEAQSYYIDKFRNLWEIPLFFEERTSIRSIHLYSQDPQTCFDSLCEAFDTIHAGGGIVKNCKGESLLIYRNDLWDLPKGKQEDGETIEDTALREVREECGINNLSLGPLRSITYHCYRYNGLFMLKKTWWYDMFTTGDESPKPQTEENIQEVRWIPDNQVGEYLLHSYASIRSIFD